ncbi:MAG: hypothetical protein J6S71_00730 [Clostridia bacterium]|nr:hypothetical protein [Clostridia bacterium]
MSGKKYFAASNTSKGFVSYFGENFRERAERCYIIKGGPGTGKSRLMHEMADAFQQAGGEVEYYYCSSDPSSLDGLYVTCDGYSVAIMDGTAPHAEDISSPGTEDNLIDLGRFWDARILRLRKSEIDAWVRKKKSAYASAYRALSAYGSLTEAADALAIDAVDIGAISDECSRLARDMQRDRLLRTPISAVGMKGMVAFDSFSESAQLALSLTDSRGYCISHIYFESLVRAVGGGRVAPHPIMPSRYCAILAGDVSITEMSVSVADDKVLDVAEFVDRSVYLMQKERIEHLRTLANGSLGEALGFFAEAGEAHMKIEEIFISAMNFADKEAYSRDLCDKIRKGDL